jgi:hypothetical protein
MDNAANCDTLAEELAKLLPHFKGSKWRIRCLLHILNLIAKVAPDAVSLKTLALIIFQAVIAFFFKEYKRKKTAKVARGAKRKRSNGSGPEEVVCSEVEVVVEEGNTVNAEEDELADALEGDAAEARGSEGGDEGSAQDAHDRAVANTIKAKATRDMAARNIFLDEAEASSALSLFPKVNAFITTTKLRFN